MRYTVCDIRRTDFAVVAASFKEVPFWLPRIIFRRVSRPFHEKVELLLSVFPPQLVSEDALYDVLVLVAGNNPDSAVELDGAGRVAGHD